MRYMIAIPCMDMVHTAFMSSLLTLTRPLDTEFCISSSSLIYDARNRLAQHAIHGKCDRVLWLDSDMALQKDTLVKMGEDMDQGMDFVSGLFFTRKAPVQPCIYREMKRENGIPTAEPIYDFPLDKPFEICGCGFGAVMTSTAMLRKMAAEHDDGLIFSPILGWGEDFSFAIRARQSGYKLWCDPRVQPGHVGQSVFNLETWQAIGDKGVK